jgi:NhaP-type Na+/H+ or K+/H+ antiporter
MVDVDPYGVGAFFALLFGVLMFAAGMYARRRGHLRNREGAAVLAALLAIIGVLVFGVGVYALVIA